MRLPTWRETIVAIVVLFAGYAILTSPQESAHVTSNAWDHIKDGASAVFAFFDGLLSN